MDIKGFQAELAEVEEMRAKLAAREDALRGDMIQQIQSLIDSLGIKASDLTFPDAARPAKRVSAPRRQCAPKFRGPNGEEWSGRGRQPRWLVEQISQGHEVEEFRIQPAE